MLLRNREFRRSQTWLERFIRSSMTLRSRPTCSARGSTSRIRVCVQSTMARLARTRSPSSTTPTRCHWVKASTPPRGSTTLQVPSAASAKTSLSPRTRSSPESEEKRTHRICQLLPVPKKRFLALAHALNNSKHIKCGLIRFNYNR